MNSFIVSATVDECVFLRTKVAHLGGAHEQVQPHGAKGGVGLCGWGGMGASQGEAPQREDGGRGR